VDDQLDAVSVANKLTVPPELVFKTLVARSTELAIFVFCIPGNCTLNLDKAAGAAGAKAMQLLPGSELRQKTGYIRGGCSPLGMTHHYPTFIDEYAQLLDTLFVSAGVRGVQVCLAPRDLARLCAGRFADLV
jgi:Cys-tRNA(Pro)/Cys-tRNA(Cys) deacylase